MQQLMSNTTI